MRRLVVACAILLAAGCKSAAPPEVKVETDEQKMLYALGYAVSEGLGPFDLTAEELAMVKLGFADGVQKKDAIAAPKDYLAKIQELHSTRVAAAAQKQREAGKAYIEKAAAEAGAKKLDSGMVFVNVKEGTGASPTPGDTVKVHYHGTLVNGKVFDSSVERGEPIEFPLGNVIPCWTQGVPMMKVGGKAKLICPPELAYGDRAPPNIGPGATLIFEVELLDIVKPQ